jgi:hypothetical protein
MEKGDRLSVRRTEESDVEVDLRHGWIGSILIRGRLNIFNILWLKI